MIFNFPATPVLLHSFCSLNAPLRSSLIVCQTANSPFISERTQLEPSNESSQSRLFPIPDPSDSQSPHQTEADLLYLNILNEAVKETTEPGQHHVSSDGPNSFARRNYLWKKLPQLDDIDNEFLVKKGVFDLPAPHHL